MLHHRLLRALAAPLLVAGLTLALAPTAQAANPETIITSGPEHGAVVLPGPVSYTFVADIGPTATFQCSVDNAPFTACTSPATYNLPPGGHLFKVRAVDGVMTPDPTPEVRIWTVRNVPCEQAGAAYREAQGKYFAWQQKLVKAKRQLHRAHNHGTAVEFQHAKNKVKRVKEKIAKYKAAMNAAIAQEQAVC